MVPSCSVVGTITILATCGALCEYCRTYCRCERSNATDSGGRASVASRSSDCRLFTGFDDCAGNVDGISDARGLIASGKGASLCDCLAAPSGIEDAMRAGGASWCAVARGSRASVRAVEERDTPYRASAYNALWRCGEC